MLKPSDVFLIWVLGGIAGSWLLAGYFTWHGSELIVAIPFWVGLVAGFIGAGKRAKVWKKVHGDTRGL